jgi:hypothetical protein
VGSQGAAAGTDIEMCDPNGGQNVLDEVLAPARVTFGKNSVIMSMNVLSSCQTAQTISMSSVGKVHIREYEIRARVDPSHGR